jgi:predicted P-loop ATPase
MSGQEKATAQTEAKGGNAECSHLTPNSENTSSVKLATPIQQHKFVSGRGQFHTNEAGTKYPKPYLTISFAEIQAMVDSPQSVAKEKARWFIPSTLLSRTFDTQKENGAFGVLWSDLDKDPRPLAQVFDTVLEDIVNYFDIEVYASGSAREDYQKGRVFVPLLHPLSGADWLLCQKVLNDKLEAHGMTPDRKSEGCAQLCYLPNRGEFYTSHYWRYGTYFDPLVTWADEIEEARKAVPPPRPPRDNTQNNNNGTTDDETVDFMYAGNWPVNGESSDGRKVYPVCPNADQHTTDSGITSTVWFRAGTNDYAQGNFECLHDHCKHIDTATFKRMIGKDADGFDVIEAPTSLPLPDFGKRTRDGKIEPTRINLKAALARPDLCGHDLRFDTFLDDLMVAKISNGGKWERFVEEVTYYEIGCTLETGNNGFKHIPDAMLRSAVLYTCKKQIFDTAQDWLNGLTWDGVPRVATFLPRYAGAADNDYTRAASLYWWSALAGRIIQPGVKADMALIAVGEQGMKKSTLVAAMVPVPDFTDDFDMSADNTEKARKMRGKLVLELGELSGFSKKTVEHIKAFISRDRETWVPKYKEFTHIMQRRCLFFGTTNTDEILVDETGNRRWLPFRSTGADPVGLAAVRDQMWAEGAHLFRKNGVMWQDAERLGKEEHAEFTVTDPWDKTVHDWLYTPDQVLEEKTKEWVAGKDCPAKRDFENSEVLTGAMLINPREQTKALETRMGKILIRFGFERVQIRIKKSERASTDDRSHRWVYRRKVDDVTAV